MDDMTRRHQLTITAHGQPRDRERLAHCSCGRFDLVTTRHPDDITPDFDAHVAGDLQPSLFQGAPQ